MAEEEPFTEESLQIPFGPKQLPAVLCRPSVPLKEDGLLVSVARAVAAQGFFCLRFTCKGLNVVHRVKAYHAVWDYFKTNFPTIKHVFLGGRSLGSRAAAALLRQLSDDTEEAARGLICLSFPLHTPSQRDTHHQRSLDLLQLPQQTTVLFVSGTQDDMCDKELMNQTVEKMKAQVDVLWLDGGSHGLAVKGRSEESVMEEVNSYITTWMRAVSTVRINFTSKSDVLVKDVLWDCQTVLKLLDNEILQTEVRVLYELLYILNNSYRGNKSYKGLQQVEQCVNRLKDMKLLEALQDLSEVCPSKTQRNVGIKSGECSVPSQPMLEWLCLKYWSCSSHESLCNQQMKWEEFVVLNMVITSMLSRLWVIFRGVLVSLSTLYEKILCLCSEVAKAKPMPFLKSPLPPNMSELLDPELLHDQTCKVTVKKHKKELRKVEPTSNFRQKQRTVKKIKEDLGVSIKRGVTDNSDLKPFVNIFNKFTQCSEELINFRREVLGLAQRACFKKDPEPSGAFKTKSQPRTNFHCQRSKLKMNVRTGSTRKRQAKQKKKSGKSKSSRRHKDTDRRTEDEAIPQSSHCDRRDDIDDIFASIAYFRKVGFCFWRSGLLLDIQCLNIRSSCGTARDSITVVKMCRFSLYATTPVLRKRPLDPD
ncbi:hypothetical protein WMY93_003339 [Mugilogobius chulae]|uniref:Testis expressed 30 n=1 Tax=Mugilogobius chulae TaxID=88201 RepID=A0AAW0PWD3_9GOBI